MLLTMLKGITLQHFLTSSSFSNSVWQLFILLLLFVFVLVLSVHVVAMIECIKHTLFLLPRILMASNNEYGCYSTAASTFAVVVVVAVIVTPCACVCCLICLPIFYFCFLNTNSLTHTRTLLREISQFIV